MTAKTLKDFFEVYRPKAGDEQKFVDKHVTIKHKDRNGNSDDVFNGKKVKYNKRKEERHGYDSGDDEAVYEDYSEEALDNLITEGKVGYKHYTITSGPEMRGMGEGRVDHVEGHPKKASNLGIKTTQGGELHRTRRVTVKNNNTGDVTHHHVYQSEWHELSPKPTLSVRHLGAATKNHPEHHNVLKHYLAGMTKIKPLSEETLDEVQRVITRGRLMDHTIGADAVKKKQDGTHRIARQFFYRSGTTSEGHAGNISKELTKSGIKHTVVDHGTEDYKPFRGGASTWDANHHWVDVKIHDKKMEVDEGFDNAPTEALIFEELIEAGNTDKTTFEEASMANIAVMKQLSLIESILDSEDLSPIKRRTQFNEAEKKLAVLEAARDLAVFKHIGTDIEEGVSVTKHNYSWGKMMTVHDGSHQSFPLYPEQQDRIRAMSKGDKTSFKDETGKTIHVERTGALVHLKQSDGNRTASVGYHHFKEEALDETAWDSELEDHHPRKVQGVMGVKSKSFQRKFKNQAHQDKFFDHPDREGNYEVQYVTKLDEDYKKVNDLKSKGEYFAAKIGHPRSYRPHFGMRSNLEPSKMEFFKGHDSVTYATRKDKLTKEDIINKAIERYIPEEVEPVSTEEYIVAIMEDYSVNHIHTILELYDSLSENNQITMLETLDTENGINKLLDFVIESRGA